jgi:hypothetical protein
MLINFFVGMAAINLKSFAHFIAFYRRGTTGDACGPQKLCLTRRWPQHSSSPSTDGLRDLKGFARFVRSWIFTWITHLDRICGQAPKLVRINWDTETSPCA